MTRSVRRRVRRSRPEQRELVGRFESSGLGAKEFCRQAGVAFSSLQRWRRRADSTHGAGFVEIVAPAQSVAPAPSWSVEVMLPNGACLRFRE